MEVSSFIDRVRPWTRLAEVLIVFAPIVAFSLLLSLVIYWSSRISLKRPEAGGKPTTPTVDLPKPDAAALDAAPRQNPGGNDEFGDMGSFSYILTASLFGLALGMLVQLFGGFVELNGDASKDSVIGAIATVIIVAVGVIGGLFSETGRISLRRPIGAIAILFTLIVSGYYWQFLRGAI